MSRYDYCYENKEPLVPVDESTMEHSMGEIIVWFEALDDAISSAISGILNRGGHNRTHYHDTFVLPPEG